MNDTSDLLARAKTHMTGNYAPPPFVVARGQGALLWDTEGREYIDLAGGIGVNALGHAHPEVVAAICGQTHKVSHTSNLFHHRGYIDVCARLAQLSFGTRVFLSNSGTESVEGALKVARRYFHERGDSKRTDLVATHGSFHGRSMGALSLTGQADLQEGFAPLLPGIRHVDFGDAVALDGAIDDKTAAVIVEPIQGNGGVVTPTPGYMKELRRLCTERGVLLIFDEVQTGIGRTGRWFAHEHEGVTPDIMTLAKGLGGGLPLGAVVFTEEVAQILKPGVHASTFGGNPVACAAGLTTIDIIEREGLLQRATTLGTSFRQTLGDLSRARDAIVQLRGRGLLVGVVTTKAAKDIQRICLERGLLITTAGPNVLRLFPPLNIPEDILHRAADILDQAIGRASASH